MLVPGAGGAKNHMHQPIIFLMSKVKRVGCGYR